MSRVLATAPAGTIVGRLRDGARVFLGIPYAAPPVGPLRFAPAVRRPRFPQAFEALAHGATPQRVPLAEVTTIPEPSIPGDDILTVDVYAPEDGVGLPVLFWVHGGGYIAGSPASPWYDGSALARRGAVVVVTSYRLGVDGFGALPGRPANLGLRDLLTALEWVQDNIAAFGGDPARVTIAGQSAGGGAVLALLASPLAEGLFSAAASLSGVDASVDRAHAEAVTAAVAARLGVPATAEGLGGVSDAATQRALRTEAAAASTPLSLAPVHGDELLPDDIVAGVRRNGTRIPLLIGATGDEFDGPPSAQPAAARAAGTRITDVLFRAVVPRIAQARAGAGAAPSWAYSFEWASPVTGGATHCVDLPFFLDRLDAAGVPEALGAQPPAELAAAMSDDLLRFVATHELPWAAATGRRGATARVYGGEAGTSVDAAGLYDAVTPEAGR